MSNKKIERSLNQLTKNLFKTEMKSGISFNIEKDKLNHFFVDNNIEKMTQVTPEIINTYINKHTTTDKDKEYVARIFSGEKLNRLSTQREKLENKIIVPEKSLSRQLHERMQSLNRIGESKFAVKMALKNYSKDNGVYINPLKNDGIYSYNTYSTYKQTSIEFTKYLEKNYPGIKKVEDITKDHAKEYLLDRQAAGKSKWTVDKDMAALNKVLQFNLTKKEVGLNRKFYHESTRSRGDAKMDLKYNPENYKDQITMAKATGIRRESMLKISNKDFIRDVQGNITSLTVKEKGGKIRTIQILDSAKNEITKIVNEYAAGKTPNEPLFNKYTKKIDNHAFRAQYARNLYAQLAEEMGDKKDYQGKWDKDILKIVSRNLGHERLTVVTQHYLR